MPYRQAGSRAKAAPYGDRSAPWRTPPLADRTISELTPREREVVMLAARYPSKEIARRLGLSARTVDNHLGRAFTKLAVSSRAELRALLGDG